MGAIPFAESKIVFTFPSFIRKGTLPTDGAPPRQNSCAMRYDIEMAPYLDFATSSGAHSNFPTEHFDRSEFHCVSMSDILFRSDQSEDTLRKLLIE